MSRGAGLGAIVADSPEKRQEGTRMVRPLALIWAPGACHASGVIKVYDED
jgi:hypothetical protein